MVAREVVAGQRLAQLVLVVAGGGGLEMSLQRARGMELVEAAEVAGGEPVRPEGCLVAAGRIALRVLRRAMVEEGAARVPMQRVEMVALVCLP